jgi:hypothetical protein
MACSTDRSNTSRTDTAAHDRMLLVPVEGATFRVPVTTLQRTEKQGVWALTHIEVKCSTLLFKRIMTLDMRGGTATSVVMGFLHVPETLKYPAYVPRIPYKLVHFRRYAADTTYVSPLCLKKLANISNGRYIMSCLGTL